jgi:signal transduction histidine kinase/DNA-binding response OmpR family regulator
LKRNFTYSLLILFVLPFLGLSTLLGQDKNIPEPYRERVNALYKKMEMEFISHRIVDVSCPLENLQNAFKEMSSIKPNFDAWWVAIEQQRENGQKDCCFNLLNALEPHVQKDKKAFLKWLFEKSKTLNAFEFKDSALAVAQRLQIEAKRTGQFQGWAALAEARAVHAKRQFDATMHLAEKALDYARKDKDKRLEMKALSLMGGASRDIYMIRPEKNVPFHEKALAIAKDLKDTSAMIYEYLSIGLSYDETPQVDRLLDYTEGAIALLTPNAPLKDKHDCIRMLTIYLHVKKDFDRAVPLYLHNIASMKSLGNKGLTQNTYEQIAGIYFEQKQYDKALAMMDSASVYSDFKSELGYFYRTYADIYEAKGDKDKAIKYYQMAFDEQVKGYTNRNSALLTEMETRFRTRETEILLEQQTKQRWLYFGLIVLLALLSGGAVYAYLKKKKANEEIDDQRTLIEKQANELRHLDEAKTRFFTNVSHELRTPLTLMLGPIASMLKRNRLDTRDATYAQMVQGHGKELLQLVNEILDLSKLESGKMQMHETTVGFQSFMRRLVSAFESHADRLDIVFQFEYKADKHLRLLIDTDKITKVVNNLLSNALKFTPQGGTIVVTVEDFAQVMRLTVSDTGRGIHPDDLPNVFNRFYQTNQKDAPVEGGTGIGLALCREFAEVMQGRIWVGSTLGKGSQFYFEFPKKEILGVGNDELGVMNEGNTEGGSAETDLGNLEDSLNLTPLLTIEHRSTILIVEDNKDLRNYIRLILSDKYHILEAENGLAALDLLQSLYTNQQIPQLILSDIMMPVMDGFQLLKVLKDRDYLQGIPVVMLTARADIQDKLTALRIGVDDYLLKPFEEEELLARVENLLRNYQNRIGNGEGRMLNAESAVEQKEDEAADIQSIQHTSLTIQKNMEWLAELEKVVAASMTQFDFHTEGVAEKLFMGRSQFFKKVKQLTGITPNEYVQEMRLIHARTLLENRLVLTVKEAALSVGFKDVRYFSELFKKRFGKLPSDYLG